MLKKSLYLLPARFPSPSRFKKKIFFIRQNFVALKNCADIPSKQVLVAPLPSINATSPKIPSGFRFFDIPFLLHPITGFRCSCSSRQLSSLYLEPPSSASIWFFLLISFRKELTFPISGLTKLFGHTFYPSSKDTKERSCTVLPRNFLHKWRWTLEPCPV